MQRNSRNFSYLYITLAWFHLLSATYKETAAMIWAAAEGTHIHTDRGAFSLIVANTLSASAAHLQLTSLYSNNHSMMFSMFLMPLDTHPPIPINQLCWLLVSRQQHHQKWLGVDEDWKRTSNIFLMKTYSIKNWPQIIFTRLFFATVFKEYGGCIPFSFPPPSC